MLNGMFKAGFAAFGLALAVGGGVFAAEGGVKGTITLAGAAPVLPPKPIPAANVQQCNCPAVPDESLVVNPANNGIQWAIIRVTTPDLKLPELAEKPPMPKIDQTGCRFVPHAVIVAPGTDLQMLNPAGIGHNVHTIPLELTNKSINQMMVTATLDVKGSKYFVEPELIQLQCDIHPWMKGYIVVSDPRLAAITDKDGNFELKGVPAGKHKIVIFQESLGEKEIEVEVKAGATTDAGKVELKKK